MADTNLKSHCDLLQIFAAEIPLGHLPYQDFVDLVVKRDVRPERPEDEDAPQLSDELWGLAERCWVKDPRARPDAVAVCDEMTRCLNLVKTSALQTNDTLPPSTIPPKPQPQIVPQPRPPSPTAVRKVLPHASVPISDSAPLQRLTKVNEWAFLCRYPLDY